MNIKILLVCFFVVLSSCNSSSNDEQLWKEILIFHQNNEFDDSLVSLHQLINNHQASQYIPNSYYLISEIYINEYKEYSISINYLNKILEFYPNHDLSKKALFTLAYIYANYLDSYTKATNSYNQFLEKYPNDDLIPSVNYELKGLIEVNKKIDLLLKIN